MPENVKSALIVALSGLGVLITVLIAWLVNWGPVETPLPSPSPSAIVSVMPVEEPTAAPAPTALPSPVVIVSETPAPPSSLPDPTPTLAPPAPTALPVTAYVLDSFERPEYALVSQFKSAVTRTILGGAVTGFAVVPVNACTLIIDPAPAAVYKMVPTTTTVGSSSAVKPGKYFDALVPLNTTNCEGTEYLWVDFKAGSYSVGGSVVTILEKGQLPAAPTKPMLMLMTNSFLTLGHYGKYQNGSEALGVAYLKEMTAHRLHPYGSYISTPPVVGGKLDLNSGGAYSYQKNVVDFSPSFTWLPNFTTTASLAAASATGLISPWFYTQDEPSESAMTALRTTLANQKLNAPNVSRMVTTSFRADLADVDIFTPVAEHFDLPVPLYVGDPTYPGESAYASKKLWLYVSCMSHGCSTDLNASPTAAKFSGLDSGAPDLTMDRSGAEPFGFMLLAQKYPSVKALLYYNVVEQYKQYSKGVDMWKGGVFNFGGNLDGTLFWPGRPGVEGLTAHVPVVSVRMKLLREAQNLADTLSLLDPAWVKTKVDALMTSPRKWTRSAVAFDELQREAMGRL